VFASFFLPVAPATPAAIAVLFRKNLHLTAGNYCFGGGLFSQERGRGDNGDQVMLSWVVTFLVIALIAGILGFGGIAGASIEIAKIIFFIALILFVVSAVVGLLRGRRTGV
jgi:uncharacterized membrane protein YtjA (UPF0391 family)